MKKILSALLLIGCIAACKNQEVEFPDYGITTGYFPYQFPIRTLILGDYIYDNSNDNAHKFLISAAMGGVYENKKDRIFKITVDNSLCNDVKFAATGEPIKAMPASYYTLSTPDRIVIPAGQVNGSVEVKLTEAFFQDTLANRLAYVIPVRITQVTDLDSLLSGKSSLAQPDPRYASQWDIAPKNFTMFAVKYISPFHGNYFHRGQSTVKEGTTTLETTNYAGQYIENDEVWTLSTINTSKVRVTGAVKSAQLNGVLNMILTFDGNNCVISSPAGSAISVTGTGKFINHGAEWGNKKRDLIELTYQFTRGTKTYSATDRLVIRDRGVVMELFTPVSSK